MISDGAREVLADELALNVIFRNLFENTLRHNPTSRTVNISTHREGPQVTLTYDDHGKKFSGNIARLGELFYKFDSSKGSGIGLYLIKNLMRKMHGDFEILNKDRLLLKLKFEPAEGGQDA